MQKQNDKNEPEISLSQQQHNSFKSAYMIVGVVAFSQGILGLSDLALSFLYKDDFQMSPAEVQSMSSFITLPWIFKPFWGIISDSYPLMGYRRKSYLTLFGIIGFLMWMSMALIITDKSQAFTALLIINISVSFCSVIGVEISQKKAKELQMTEVKQQEEASRNVSFFFGIRSIGFLLTAYLSGELLEFIDKHTIFLITAFFPLILVFVSRHLEEEKIVYKENERQVSMDHQIAQLKCFKTTIMEPAIYRPILFILMFMMTPSPGTAMFYFYINELKFSPEFLGQLKFIYAIGSILAVTIYNKFLKAVEFKKQFIVTTVICVVLGYSQLLLVSRKNVALGIPDKLFTLGDSVIIQVFGEMNSMPLLVLACRMCPKNIEGTMYALIMSSLNFGSILSSQFGGLFTYYMGVTENDFTNLGWLLVISNTIQLIPLFLINMVDITSIKKSVDNIEKIDMEFKQNTSYARISEEHDADKSGNHSGSHTYLTLDQDQEQHFEEASDNMKQIIETQQQVLL